MTCTNGQRIVSIDPHPMSEYLTRVELFYLKNHVNYWLRFGDFSFEKNIDRRRAYVWFMPDHLFCYIRWWANDYGTKEWTLAILRSCTGHKDGQQGYHGINPGAEILLYVKGSTYVKRVLIIFDEIDGQNINLGGVSPDYYRYLGQCIPARGSPHPYGIDQHRAFLKSRKMGW